MWKTSALHKPAKCTLWSYKRTKSAFSKCVSSKGVPLRKLSTLIYYRANSKCNNRRTNSNTSIQPTPLIKRHLYLLLLYFITSKFRENDKPSVILNIPNLKSHQESTFIWQHIIKFLVSSAVVHKGHSLHCVFVVLSYRNGSSLCDLESGVLVTWWRHHWLKC